MMETDNLSQNQNVGQRDGSSPRAHSPARPMRQLEFNQAMSDFRHMFPETDEEVIEAVLRANSGMVDATIDQLLTMNIDAEFGKEDEDDLPDHVLMSVQQEVMAQQQTLPSAHGVRESKSSKKALEALSSSKDGEDCPPSYTEAVQSHLSHNYRGSSSRRHRHSPTISTGYNSNGMSTGNTPSGRSGNGHHHHHRMPRNGMQHLLDLGPESAPPISTAGNVSPPVSSSPVAVTQSSGHSGRSQHSRHHHHHHHHQRSSNHHRRKADNSETSSPHHKSSRPGRNLLATMAAPHNSPHTHYELASDDFGFRPQRKESSFDNNQYNPDSRQEKSPQMWRSSGRESSSTKRPAFKNWNPPMLGTLPDHFLRIMPASSSPILTQPKHSTHLHRTMSALGPERPRFTSQTISVDNGTGFPLDSQMTSSFKHSSRPSGSSTKPHRSQSFAGHSSHRRAPTTLHPSASLAQHDIRSDILQERMKENERRRHIAVSSGLGPELTQYLEDERLAIMLQNSEFLQTLRGDRTFMMSLEQDHSSRDGDDLPSVPDTTTIPVIESTFAPINTNGLGSDEEEGYGDEGRQTLEAFPFSKQLPPPATSEDMELRKKLKHMGKASRKQFAALARKFFSKRKKKNAHQILKESQAPSMMNLLDDDDEDDDDNDEMNNGGLGTVSGSMRNSWNERQGRRFDEV